MQHAPQTSRQRIIMWAFVAAAVAISLAVHYANEARKQREKEWLESSSGLSVTLSDGRNFRAMSILVPSRTCFVVATPSDDPSVCGTSSDEKGKRYVTTGVRADETTQGKVPARNYHVYLLREGKIVRELPYAELGIPEVAEARKNAVGDKAWDDAYFSLIGEKITTYLETHADEIFGPKPETPPEVETPQPKAPTLEEQAAKLDAFLGEHPEVYDGNPQAK